MADHGDNSNGDEQEEEYSKKPYYWFYGRDLDGFFATVSKYGYDNVYIEVRESKEEKEAYLVVKLLDSGGEVVGHYNFSHSCPPDCTE